MTVTPTSSQVPIAIIGLACRFPGEATSPSKFWDMLKNGRDAYSPSTDRYNAEAFYHPNASNRQNVLATKGGHFLNQDPYTFDAAFFNITAAEAISFDPKQRIAMEVTYEALESAGKSLQQVAGTQTACFIGSSMSDYRDAVVRDFGHSPKYHILGTCEEMISNRVSHFFDIHGPSATIHTACSSSLVAIHFGCQSLKSGESEMAFVGGVGMIISPDGNMQLSNLGFLNPDGHSRTFDADAGGYGRGEGCGILVLKRLDKAIEDGDPIRAVIRATGANSDGWTQGVTMPSSEAQAALIRYVYESNGLDYRSTQYVEAHGTGTKAGDPAEIGAIHKTIGQGATKARKLWVGSVKPNIGHLEAAAGVAGVIKGVLAMEHGQIPPNIHFSRPNPAIPFEEWNMAVPTKLTPWPAGQNGQRRMSVSGFGMGGTNGHVVLESFSAGVRTSPNGQVINGHLTNGSLPTSTESHHAKRLFVFSSQDQAGFHRLSKVLADHLDSLGPAANTPEYLARLAHTLAVTRGGLAWKDTFQADSIIELRAKLSGDELGQSATRVVTDRKPLIGFVFTGQGAQWARMGIQLLARPAFKKSVARSSAILMSLGCVWDPVEELSRSPSESRLSQPEISQPICTILQIALVDELRGWDITPNKVVGHSSGEIAAAYTVGAISHRDAVAVAYFRGKAATGLQHLDGGMMAVGGSREEIQKIIDKNDLGLSGSGAKGGRVSVACVNSPDSVTVSGDVAALDHLHGILTKTSVFARRLKVEVAYHSTHMNAATDEYLASISDIEPAPRTLATGMHCPEVACKMVSSVTGYEVDADELGSPFYWARNLVSPVLFEDALVELITTPGDGPNAVDFLVELGPHSALRGPIKQILSHHGIQNVGYGSMLIRGDDALDSCLNLARDLFRFGAVFGLHAANGDIATPRLLTTLPPYPWNHSKAFRADSRLHREMISRKFPTRSLIGAQLPAMSEYQHEWRNFIRLSDEPWLRGHTVGSTVLFPGAGIVSLVLEAAQQLVEQGQTARAFRLRDVSLFAAIALPEDMATELIIHFRPHLLATASTNTPATWWEFTVSSCIGFESDQLRDNASGLVTIDYEETQSPQMVAESAMMNDAWIADYHRLRDDFDRNDTELCSKERFYQHMVRAAWSYGDLFQGVENCRPAYGTTTFDIRLVDVGETFSKGQIDRPFLINAASLDAVFQSWLGGTYKDGAFELDKPFVPTSIGSLEISANIPADANYIMPGLCHVDKYGINELSADIVCFDTALSTVFLSVSDFRTSELEIDSSRSDGVQGSGVDPTDITSEVKWDYALGLLKPNEISSILGRDPVPLDRQLRELLRLAIFQDPAAIVIEVIPNAVSIGDNAATQTISHGLAASTRTKYAVADQLTAGDDQGALPESPFDQMLSISESGSPTIVTDRSPADIVLISDEHFPQWSPKSLGNMFKSSLRHLAKPGAIVMVLCHGSNATLSLESQDFQIISRSRLDDNKVLALRRQQTSAAVAIPSANAPQGEEFVIVSRSASSAGCQEFAAKLQQTLQQIKPSCSISIWSWSDDICGADVQGKTFISLLELEQPLLDDLSSQDFDKIRTLVLNCQRLLWITAGDDPAFGMIDGFSRCIRTEMGGIVKFQVLHLAHDQSHSLSADSGPLLAARIISNPASTFKDDEYREVDGKLQISRIFKSQQQNDGVRHHLEDSVRTLELADQRFPLRLTIGKPGLLDTLRFVNDARMSVPLKDNEVEVQVKATGLNFRDVMACMALIPVQLLGQEASGVVIKAGSKVTDWKVGDRVSTIYVGAHATVIRTDSQALARIPDAMSFEEAAAIPIANFTAYYAFVSVAKLQRGQSVLIHTAAGGVGQAAVQLAKHLGLVIYATVGTEEKRNLLVDQYGIAPDRIFHSRDTSFVKGIRRVTGGRGVDCVLNSLSGELLRASWGCLATFGTFIEIGLRDITNNMRLDMRPFRKSTSFVFVNNNTLYEEDRENFYRIFHQAMDLVMNGTLRAPHPVTAYPISQAEEAFRMMQQGKHRGKVVLSFADGHAPVLCRAQDSLRLDAQATYLIVGGLGGLGRSLAKEFATAGGARNIAFISRSGDASASAKGLINELSAQGVCVKAYRADISDWASFSTAMAQCSREMPPIKGVIQMAMVLRDIVFEKMSFDEWAAPVGPKVQGTWNLHQYFGKDRPLDFMIFCSSTSGIYGYPSQAQYAAGNTYQDALAATRCSQGLKATSVNLGIMRDVGILAETGTSGNIKLWEEVLGIREPAFHALIKSLINQQSNGIAPTSHYPAQVCTGLGTADIMARHGLAQPEYFQDPRFGPLAILSESGSAASAEHDGSSTTSLASRLAKVGSKEQAAEIVTEALIKKTADILQIPVSEVDPGRPLYRYGVDSLVALEVRNWITKNMMANMALLEILAAVPISSFAAKIAEKSTLVVIDQPA